MPVASGKLIMYFDRRKGKKGDWIIPADYKQNPSHNKPTLIENADNVLNVFFNQEYYYYENKQHEWWRYHCKSGKRERLNGSFPVLDGDSRGMISNDGEELIYIVHKYSGKLLMIENLFQ